MLRPRHLGRQHCRFLRLFSLTLLLVVLLTFTVNHFRWKWALAKIV